MIDAQDVWLDQGCISTIHVYRPIGHFYHRVLFLSLSCLAHFTITQDFPHNCVFTNCIVYCNIYTLHCYSFLSFVFVFVFVVDNMIWWIIVLSFHSCHCWYHSFLFLTLSPLSFSRSYWYYILDCVCMYEYMYICCFHWSSSLSCWLLFSFSFSLSYSLLVTMIRVTLLWPPHGWYHYRPWYFCVQSWDYQLLLLIQYPHFLLYCWWHHFHDRLDIYELHDNG